MGRTACCSVAPVTAIAATVAAAVTAIAAAVMMGGPMTRRLVQTKPRQRVIFNAAIGCIELRAAAEFTSQSGSRLLDRHRIRQCAIDRSESRRFEEHSVTE